LVSSIYSYRKKQASQKKVRGDFANWTLSERSWAVV
jgi:hypothetical protein